MNLVSGPDTAVSPTWNLSHWLTARTEFDSGISGRRNQWLPCCSSRVEAHRTPVRFLGLIFLSRTSFGMPSPETQRTHIA